MDSQLLFLLFILFSVVSALLERRKRKRANEEAQRRAAGQNPPVEDELEEEGEELQQWPFPMGDDPFEPPRQRPRASRSAAPDEEEDAVSDAGEAGTVPAPAVPLPRKPALLERLEREALEIERHAQVVEAQAKESAAQLQQVQPRRRVQELVRDQVAHRRAEQSVPRAKKKGRWRLTANSARDAVVYAEILGPPKAERGDEYR